MRYRDLTLIPLLLGATSAPRPFVSYCAVVELNLDAGSYRECWHERLGFRSETGGASTVVDREGNCWVGAGGHVFRCDARGMQPHFLKALSSVPGTCERRTEVVVETRQDTIETREATREIVERDSKCRPSSVTLRTNAMRVLSRTRYEYDKPEHGDAALFRRPDGSAPEVPQSALLRQSTCIRVDEERICDDTGALATVGFDVDELGVVTRILAHAGGIEVGDRVVSVQGELVPPKGVGDRLRGSFGDGIGVGTITSDGTSEVWLVKLWRIVRPVEATEIEKAPR